MHKMIANAVTFEHPMQKIYTVLPPPIEEMDEVLAFIFTGPCQPTEDDFAEYHCLCAKIKWLKRLNGSSLIIEIMQILKFHIRILNLSRRLPTCCNKLSTFCHKQDSRGNQCP